MAVWKPQSFDITKINKNTRYEDGNIPNAEAIDAAIEGAAFAQDKAEEAASSAASAESSASAAKTAATNAQNSASAAQQSASTAAENARNAANSAAQATAYASAAQQSASAAAEDASEASNSASQAASNVSAAASSAAAAQQSASTAEATANNMMSFVNALTDPPDLTDVGNVGTPSVSFVANGEYKKFKFSNLKGEKGDTGASISDVNFVYNSETSIETIYDVQTVLADGTTVDSGQISIPKATIPVISEFASSGQTQPSADLIVGGFFFTEVQ